MLDVQITVDRDMKNAVTTQTQPSNAGVIGAGLFGAVGGAIGGAIAAKKEQEQKEAALRQLHEYQANVMKLFNDLKKVGEKFGWPVNIV